MKHGRDKTARRDHEQQLSDMPRKRKRLAQDTATFPFPIVALFIVLISLCTLLLLELLLPQQRCQARAASR